MGGLPLLAAALCLLPHCLPAQTGTSGASMDAATKARLNQSFQAGVAAIEARQWDDAIAKLKETVAIDAAQPAAWVRLGQAYAGAAGGKNGAEAEAALQKAIECYDRAVTLKPGDASFRNNYAIVLGKAGKLPEMQAQIEQAIVLDPANAGKYYYNLAASMVNAGNREAAEGIFRKAVESAPATPDVYFQYGSVLMPHARLANGSAMLPAEAMGAFRKYLELAPDGPHAGLVKAALAFHGSAVVTSFGEPVPGAGNAQGPLPVGSSVEAEKLRTSQQPVYPPMARSLRVEGTVVLRALIGEDGTVLGLAVDSGHPMLIAAALDAVKTWVYEPLTVDGKPVRVRTEIDVVFQLQR